MKTVRKGCGVLIGIFVFLLLAVSPVLADAEITLDTNVQKAERGGEVVLSLRLGEEAKLYAYSARLSYDKNVFAPVDTDSFQLDDQWSDIVYNSANHKFGLINKAGESGTNVLQIKFRVKEDAPAGDAVIQVDQISAADTEGQTISISGDAVSVYIMENALDETNPGGDASKSEIENAVIEAKAGHGSRWLAVLFVVLILVAAATVVLVYRKVQDKTKRSIASAVCAIAVLVLLFGTVKVLTIQTPDVNKDGSVDYEDAREVMEYLLALEPEEAASADKTPENGNGQTPAAGSSANQHSGADVNHDGRVNISDVGNIVQDAGDQTQYTASLQEPVFEAAEGSALDLTNGVYYFTQGTKQMTLGFVMRIYPVTLAKSVIINGKAYPLESYALPGGDRYYTAQIPLPETIGETVSLHMTGLILDNGRQIAIDHTVQTAVLKQKPQLAGYRIYEEGNSYKLLLNIADPDQALRSGILRVTGEDNSQAAIDPSELKAGENIYTLQQLTPGMTYQIGVMVYYDLDQDARNQAHEGMDVLLSEQFTATVVEGTISGASAAVDSTQKKVTIRFESRISPAERSVRGIIVNGREYPVIREDGSNVWQAEIPYDENIHTVYTISGLVLDNSYQLNVDAVTLETFLPAPEAALAPAAFDEKQHCIDAAFTLSDPAGVVSAYYAVLSKNGKILETKSLQADAKSVRFDLDSRACAGDYRLELAADYDTVDGKSHTMETLDETALRVATEAAIRDAALSEAYPHKKAQITVTVDIASNTDAALSAITVNGTEYIPEKTAEGKYAFSYTAADRAGKEEIRLEALRYDTEICSTDTVLTAEVLKDKPAVKDLVFDDSKDEHILSFAVADADGALLSGSVLVSDAAGNICVEENFTPEEAPYSFPLQLKENGVYHIQVELTYDLDSNPKEPAHQTREVLAQKDVEVLVDYQFSFSDAKVDAIDYDNKTVTLSFRSSNATKYYGVAAVRAGGKDYPVTKEGERYVVKIALPARTRTTLTITEAILEDQTRFSVDPKETGFVVFKTLPKAELTTEAGTDEIRASYTVNDPDETLQDLKLVLKGADQTILAVKNARDLENGTAVFEGLQAGSYRIALTAAYDAADGRTHSDEVIVSEEVQIDYLAQITEAAADKPYVQKAESLLLTLHIYANTKEAPAALVINNRKYTPKPLENGDYQIAYTAGTTAGVEEIHITELQYGETTLAADASLQVEVLKSVPKVAEFTFDGSDEEPKAIIKIEDPDGAWQKGSLIVTGVDDFRNEIPLEKDTGTYALGIEKNGIYQVSVSLSYDLDQNPDNGENQKTETAYSKEVEVVSVYHFSFQNAALVSVDAQQLTATLRFESSNDSLYGVQALIVNGTACPVQREENLYTVQVPLGSRNRQELHITEAVLENQKHFPAEASFIVFRKAPEATLSLRTGSNRIDASFRINDPEQIAAQVQLQLCDISGRVLETRQVASEGAESFTVTSAGRYRVRLSASYDAADGLRHEQETLATQEAAFAISVSSLRAKADQVYAEKKENVALDFTLNDNTYETPESFVIDGTAYPAEALSGDDYRIYYPAGETAGSQNVTVTAVNYAAETVSASCDMQMEVLKDVPAVKDFVIDSSEGNRISFTLEDEDAAFLEGQILIDGPAQQSIPMQKDKAQQYTLDLSEEGIYTVRMEVRYDRDSDAADPANQEETVLFTTQIELRDHYNLTLKDAVITSVDVETRTVGIAFTAVCDSIYQLTHVVVNGQDIPVRLVDENRYQADIQLEKCERTTLAVTQAVLENRKMLEAGAQVIAFKNLPRVDMRVQNNGADITVDYQVSDEDQTISSAKLQLKDAQGTVLKELRVTQTQDSVQFTSLMQGSYEIIFVVSYDAADGLRHEGETLAAAKAEIAIAAGIINSRTEEKYVTRGSEIPVYYEVLSNSTQPLTAVTVNNESYAALLQNDGTYRVNVPAGNNAGPLSLQASALYFGSTAVNVTHTDEVYVLKDVPALEIVYDNSGDQPKLSVELNDPDQAVTSGEITLLDGVQTVRQQALSSGTNAIDLSKLQNNHLYNLTVSAKYDRDGDQDTATNSDVLVISKEIVIISDYHFSLQNLKLVSLDPEEKTATLSFESANISSVHTLTHVRINDQDYPVEKLQLLEENEFGYRYQYNVTVPYETEERTAFTLTEALLDNQKRFTDLTESVVIFKDTPVAEDAALTIDDTGHCSLSFQVKDPDQTLTKVSVLLTDWKGDTLEQKDCTVPADGNCQVAFRELAEHAGKYQVQILAEYDLADGAGLVQDALLGTAEAEIEIEIQRATADPTRAYVEKGSVAEIAYTVADNVRYQVKNAELTITTPDGQEETAVYDVEVLSETQETSEFKVKLTLPQTPGVEKVALSKINYMDPREQIDAVYSASVSNCITELEVLKDQPQITDYAMNLQGRMMRFAVVDPDTAMQSVKAEAVAKADSAAVSLPLTQENGVYTANLSQLNNSVYTLRISLAYDRDQDSENIMNQNTLTMEKEVDFSVYYGATLQSTALQRLNLQEQQAYIDFTAAVTENGAASDLSVESAWVNDTAYPASKNGEVYTIMVPYQPDTPQEIVIQAVSLANGETIACSDNNRVALYLTAPTVSDLTLTLAENRISASYTLTDEAGILQNLQAVLKNAAGEELGRILEVSAAEGKGTVSFTEVPVTKAGTYTVSLLGSYQRNDGVTHENEELKSANLTVATRTKLTLQATNRYVEKGAQVPVTVSVEDNTDRRLTAVEISGTEYEATAVAGAADSYVITLTAPQTAGPVSWQVTKTIYDGAVEVEPQTEALQLEVLKTAPAVSGYIMNPDSRVLSFTVTDPDETLLGGGIYLCGSDDSEKQLESIDQAQTYSISVDEELSDGVDYHVEIRLSYDLDQNKQAESENYQKDALIHSALLEFVSDQEINIEHIQVTAVDQVNKTVNITFQADGDNYHHITDVAIEDVEYQAAYDETTDTYTVEGIAYEGEDGTRQIFLFNRFVLETGMTVEVTDENCSFVIFRTVPVVENMQVAVDKGNADVSFTLKDEEKTASQVYVSLRREKFNSVYGNYDTEIMDREIVTEQNGSYHVVLQVTDLENSYDFFVDVAADYEVTDGETHIEETLSSQAAEVKITASILDDSITSPQNNLGGDEVGEIVKKKQKVRVAFEVADNTEYDISRMMINGQMYTAEKDRPTDRGNIYLVDMETSEEAGARSFHVSKMYYGATKDADVDYDTKKLTILKSVPTLTDYVDGGTEDHPFLSFTFSDPDGALLQETADFQILDANKQVKEHRQLTPGQSYRIDMDDYADGIYTVIVTASYNIYDDPSKAQMNQSLLKDSLLGRERRIQIIKGYHFKADIMPVEMAAAGMGYMFHVGILDIKDDLDVKGFKLLKLHQKEDGNYEVSETYTENGQLFLPYNNKDTGMTDYDGWIYDWQYEKGVTYVLFESFTLSDGTEIIQDFYSSYSVVNKTPEATGVKLQEDSINDTVTATAVITDTDQTINRLEFRLKAANGRLLGDEFMNRKEVQEVMTSQNGQFEMVFDKEMPLTSQYRLEVIAEYDMEGRGESFRKTTMGTASLNAKERVVIREHQISNSYPEKGEDLVLGYRMVHNLAAGIEIVGMVVNGEVLDISSTEGDWYRFRVTAPVSAGTCDYTASAIVLSNKEYALEKKEGEYNLQPTDTVDVLKDVPYVESYSMDTDYSNASADLTVTLADPDHALLEGNEGLAKVSGIQKDLHAGTTTVTFNGLTVDRALQMDIMGNYDRDSNPDNGANGYSKSLLVNETPLDFMLLSDYGLQIKDLEVTDSEGRASAYFEKGARMNLRFTASNKANEDLKSITVQGSSYDVTKEKDGSYTAQINGDTRAGKTTVAIDQVMLQSGQTLSGSDANDRADVEILKDAVSVEKFRHTSTEDTVTMDISLKDEDDSLIGDTAQVTVAEPANGKTVASSTITVGKENEISFTAGDSRKYDVSIVADYQRDADGTQTHQNEEIYHKTVSMDDRSIEMKEILNVSLFKIENGNRVPVETIDYDDFVAHQKDYVVKVDMTNLPSFYSTIEDYEKTENQLILKISYEGLVSYHGEIVDTEYLEIAYDSLGENLYAYEGSFEALMKAMQAEPDGNFVLDKDYDASTYQPDTNTYLGNVVFRGKLDGNGHTISNLNKALFYTMEDAEVKNLYLTDIVLTAASDVRGTLATSAKRSNVKNVHMDRVNLTAEQSVNPGYGAFGGLIGDVYDSTVIEECSATNVQVSNFWLSQIGGTLVRSLNNSTIRNCYTEGVASGGWWGNAGIAGSADQNARIENCIVNFSLTPSISETSNANIVGQSNNATLINNISIARKNSGHVRKVCGGALSGGSSNNYQLSDVAGTDVTFDSVQSITSADLSESFYKDRLHLDPAIWDMTNASATQIPTLRGNRQNAPYVPEYDRLNTASDYYADKEIAYSNLYKLTPFYDASYILADAAKIDSGDTLNTKMINGVIPYDTDGNILYVLDTQNYDRIAKIALVYSDLTMEEYSVSFDTYFGDIACYDIPDLGLKYTFNHYVINTASPLIDEMVSYLKNQGSYTRALDSLTTARDSNTYKNYYDEFMMSDESLRAFVIKVLANCDYAVTGNNATVNTAIREELLANNRLKELLYTYNYFMRWYNFNIGAFNIADMTMFKGDIFNARLNLNTMTASLLSNPASTMRTGATQEFYSAYIGGYTGIATLPEYLNYFIESTHLYTDVNDWFTENFSGYIREMKMDPIPGLEDIRYDELKYRAWEHLAVRSNLLLPLITAPKRSTYIISYPTTIAIGATRCYIKDPADEEQYAQFERSADGWAALMKQYYNMYLGILSGGGTDVVDLFNSKDDVVHDNTHVYESAEAEGRVWADVPRTTEPYHKWVAEPTGYYYYHPDNYAVANGWRISYAQGNYFGNMLLYSHEAAHNQDGAIFFKGKGRRKGANAESYTTSFFTQSFPDGSPQINGTYLMDENSSAANNLTPERINTTAKIDDFYEKMFDTSNYLDYLIGEAFLKLSSDEQARIVSKYTAGVSNGAGLTAAELENMHLDSVADLVNNGLVLGAYGSQSLWVTRWFEPHSNNLILDDTAFHYLCYEMLGYAGYDNGYIQYAGNVYNSDVEALQQISKTAGDSYQSFEDYKIGEYEKLAAKKNQVAYMNPDEAVKAFEEALRQDVTDESSRRSTKHIKEAKKYYYLLLKHNTDDFRGEVFQENQPTEARITTAQQFVNAVTENKYAKLIIEDNLDFSEITGNSAICGVTFLGSIEGGNHTISNLKLPLFKTMNGCSISDLVIKDSALNTNYDRSGFLARSMENCTVSNVKLQSSEIYANNRSRVGGITGEMTGGSMAQVQVHDLRIYDAKETGAAAGYITGAAIRSSSASQITITGNMETAGALIGQATDSTVQRSYADGVSITARINVGGLIGAMSGSQTEGTGSSVEECYSRNVTISASTKIGGLVGYMEKNSRIADSSAAHVTLDGAADSVGGLIGEMYDSTVENCYAADASSIGRSYIGGFAGYTVNPVIRNCYIQGSAECRKSYVGGFVGSVRSNNGDDRICLENNLTLAVVKDNAAKFDCYATIALITSTYHNNIEITEYPGNASSVRGIPTSAVRSVSLEELKADSFYTTQLKWPAEKWNFTAAVQGGLPVLTGNGNALTTAENTNRLQIPAQIRMTPDLRMDGPIQTPEATEAMPREPEAEASVTETPQTEAPAADASAVTTETPDPAAKENSVSVSEPSAVPAGADTAAPEEKTAE